MERSDSWSPIVPLPRAYPLKFKIVIQILDNDDDMAIERCSELPVIPKITADLVFIAAKLQFIPALLDKLGTRNSFLINDQPC